jgi:hypothetical protein
MSCPVAEAAAAPTLTLMLAEDDIPPPVPVTVTVYVPAASVDAAEIFNVLLQVSVQLEDDKLVLNPATCETLNETDSAFPLKSAAATMSIADWPCVRETDVFSAETMNVVDGAGGVAGGVAGADTVANVASGDTPRFPFASVPAAR